MNNLYLVIRREYLERVRKKSFIITTILMPIIMVALMLAPTLLMTINTSSAKNVAVIDQTPDKIVATALVSDESVHFVVVGTPLDSVLRDDSFEGILEIGPNLVANPNDARLLTHDAAPMEVVSNINHQLSRIVEQQRMDAYKIDDLRQIINEVQVDVNISTSRITDTGEETETSQLVSMIVAFAMTFILYMFLVLYGQMVMTSIIEEKNNRVLEIMVSSVKPAQMMLGKILGVGMVAITQVLIWGVIIVITSGILLPALMPTELASEVAAYNAGSFSAASAANDVDLVQALAAIGSVDWVLSIMGYMLLFFIGGFLLYAAMNAAFGSAVDNIQDAGQLQTFIVIPILVAFIFTTGAISDPNSSLSVAMSMIPFTSPMVMMARIPFGIAAWEIWLSLVILYASFFAMVWLAAKIYRVGIFMYGKKPTIKDLIRWARYK